MAKKKNIGKRGKRNLLLSKYKDRAKKYNVRLNYSRIKKIDIESEKKGRTFESSFRILLKEKIKKSTKYYSKKYEIPLPLVQELYKESIEKNIKMNKLIEHEKNKPLEFPIANQNFLDIIDFTRSDNFLEKSIINVVIFGESYSGSLNMWNNKLRFDARKFIEDESSFGEKYAVVNELFEVKTERNKEGKIFSLVAVSLNKKGE